MHLWDWVLRYAASLAQVILQLKLLMDVAYVSYPFHVFFTLKFIYVFFSHNLHLNDTHQTRITEKHDHKSLCFSIRFIFGNLEQDFI